jgi:hypothetical protein
MSRVRRFDRVAIPASKRTQEGFLKIDGNKIARTGIQEYRRADGSMVRELRPAAEVFDTESMASFALLPLTDNHPAKMLDATDAKKHAVGSVGQPKKDGDWLSAPISVWDAAAITSIESGRVELSAGYSCEIVEEPGEWNGERYDCKQVAIRANHLALVDSARAGPEARLRLDAGDAEATEFAGDTTRMVPLKQEQTKMAHVLKVDGMTFETNDQNAQAAVDRVIAATKREADEKSATEKQRADNADKLRADAEKSRDEWQAKYDALCAKNKADDEKLVKCDECDGTGKVDGERCDGCDGKGEYAAKMDTAERRVVSLKRRIDRGVHERAKLYSDAQRVLGLNEKLDGKSTGEIKRLVILKLDKDAKLDGKSEDYVSARYDVAMEQFNARRPIDGPRLAVVQAPSPDAPRADHAPSQDPEEARRNMINRTLAANSANAKR